MTDLPLLLLWLGPTIVGCLILISAAKIRPMWWLKSVAAEAAIALFLASLPFLFVLALPAVGKVLLAIAQGGLVLVAARLLFGRLEQPFLQTSTAQNVVIALASVAIILLGSLLLPMFIASREALLLLAAVSLALGAVLLGQTIWMLWHYRLRHLGDALPHKDLPTVSVCIPARNENHALTECLRAVLASDYPKLEVLVLDDCSQDATSDVIRSFAHGGVRFVQGEQPATGWLGRNQAMQTLAEHATGQLLLFMSVDTRVSPNSISQLVRYMRAHKTTMASVLPQQRSHLAVSAAFPTLQYFWRIALPLSKRHVPVSGKCWLIEAATLKSLGGFASVSHKVVPEASFARRLFVGDKYRFIVSDPVFGVTTAKKWSSQVETSIRLLYPTLKRQPFYALAALVAVVTLLLLPFTVVVSQIWFMLDPLLLGANVAATFLFVLSYALVVSRTLPHSWAAAMLAFPVSLAQECVLIFVSMAQYEFGEVNWKGRNVCYPVILEARQKAKQQTHG